MTLLDAPAVLEDKIWQYAAPKYYTRRDLTARSDGGQIAHIAAALGKIPMEWQQYVADVATEHEDDGSLRYEIVMVTVPRQSGKTTLVAPVQLHRVITNPGIKCWYTAQTGKDATARFKDLVQLVNKSPLQAVAKPRFSAGTESLTFPNSSSLNIFAPVKSALHGETPPLVTLDEIWEYDEDLGDAILEDTIIPAQMTLVGRRQVWLISTAGTAQSTFMRKWVERGRRGSRPKMAYFEWSLRDGDDPYDPEAIERFHPAVGQVINGHRLTAADILANAAEDPDTGERMSHAKWLRGFCNVWTEAREPIMSADDWSDLVDPTAEPPARSAIAVTYDVAPGNTAGRVLASYRDEHDRPCIRVLHAAPGTTWMLPYLLRINRDWEPAVLGADNGGPTKWLTDELRRRLGDDAVRTTTGAEYGTACGALLKYARDDRTLRHDGSATLAREISHLVINTLNGGIRFDRERSTGPVAGLIAAAVGIWLYDHQEESLGMPEIYT